MTMTVKRREISTLLKQCRYAMMTLMKFLAPVSQWAGLNPDLHKELPVIKLTWHNRALNNIYRICERDTTVKLHINALTQCSSK